MKTYGEHAKITVSRYQNNNNIAILLDDGRYDVLTTNGEENLSDDYVGIRDDEQDKILFAKNNKLIDVSKPVTFEPSGYVAIIHFRVTDKLKSLLSEYDAQK